MHNSNGLRIGFEQRSKCDVILARPMSSTRRLFVLWPRVEYIWNGSRCLNQLGDAFGETWGHFPDAGAFSPEPPKSAYFGGLVPPLYR